MPLQFPLAAALLAAIGFAVAGAGGCASDPLMPDDDDDDDDVAPGPDGGGGWGDAGMPDPNGCPGTSAAAHPFGEHAFQYASGSILPDRPQGDLDSATQSYYDHWKSQYVRSGCADGQAYIFTNGPDNAITVSEGHGYGMVILAYMAGHDAAAQELFDSMYRYFRAHPSGSHPDRMAWAQSDGCLDSEGADSATDGDLDIGYALLLADRQWGSGGEIDYRAEAIKVINAIRAGDVDTNGDYTLLGDWTSPGDEFYDATRSSDFMPDHFWSFEQAVGGGAWSGLLSSSYDMVSSLQSQYAPATGLLPDFILHPATNPAPVQGMFLEQPNDGQYAYNACRVPMRLGIHFLVTGDARAHDAVQRINRWISDHAGDPDGIGAGYYLDGNSLPNSDYTSMAFTAPFAVGAMVDGANQDWLNALWDNVASSGDGDYYADTLKLMAMLALSGNWWPPESAPCGGM